MWKRATGIIITESGRPITAWNAGATRQAGMRIPLIDFLVYSRSLLVPPQRDHPILGVRTSHVAPAVLFIGSDKPHRTRTQIDTLSGDGDLERPFAHQHHLFVRVMMRRMRSLARG